MSSAALQRNHLLSILGIALLAFLPTVAGIATNIAGEYGVGLTLQVIIQLALPVIATVYMSRVSIVRAFLVPIIPTPKRVDWTEYMGIGLAISAIVIILSAYYIFRPLLDIAGIKDSLMTRNGVTAVTYPWVALSVALINPFLEEYFWRGFIYRTLRSKVATHRWKQVVLWLAGLLFALHHTIIFHGWFVWWQWILVTVFLALVGVLFNWLYEKSGSILVSLMVHTAADITLAFLGLTIFGIIHF